jgi:hypothetical protein
MTQQETTKFDQWGIVDVMGHQRYIGRISEEMIAGQGFIRIDVPETSAAKTWTKIIGTSSIYAITPTTEEIARAMAANEKAVPINKWELPDELRERIEQPLMIESKPAEQQEYSSYEGPVF